MNKFRMLNGTGNKTEKETDYDAEVTRHRIKRVLKWVFIIGLILTVLISFYNYLDRKVYTGYTVTARSVRSDSETARYMQFNGHILKYSQDGAEAFDGMDKSLWNITYEMQSPKIATCEDFVAITDEGSTNIVVTDSSGVSTSIDTRLPVMDICVAGQGVVAAVLSDKSATKINVYDKEGNQLAGLKCTMVQTGYPLDISLSPSGTLLGVSYLRMDAGELKSSVAFYNFGNVGENEVDHYVSGFDYTDAVFPRIKFLDDSSVIAVGNNKVVTYSGAQKPQLVSENSVGEEIQSVFYGDDEYALVFRNTSGSDSYRIDLFDEKGVLKMSKDFELAYSDIQITKRQILIYNESECLIMNKRGFVKYSGKFEDSVLLMVPGRSFARYILINRDITQTIRLD
ncbi:MAG: DUF5711 family protein [Lachnospiraceae bacterium]|nr:DUF5711 family protein [Lachnospiraceae bacterium]